METGYSTVRSLLYVVLVIVVLGTLSNFYVATQLARNSDELASLRQLLAKQLMGTALSQADELKRRLDALNESASGVDGKLKKAQDEFAARMEQELPRIMDTYVKQRAAGIEKQIEKRAGALPRP